jgi:polyhydroxybutyrate depolymerase
VLGGVVSNSPYTSIIDGSVSFGDLLAGATATSSDTFTVRHNRTVAFSTNNFSINYSYNAFPPLTSGLKTMMSGGKLRQYYLKVPLDYSPSGVAKPLIVTYHGTGGSYLNWLGGNNYYRDFAGYVGDNAIMVFPQALPNGNGVNQWDYKYDLQYFRDIAAELKTFVNYNSNKLFVVGHSSGGGIAHEIGCQSGDLVRATAPVAGALVASTCVGSAAVIQIQGTNDTLSPVGLAAAAKEFWVKYNGLDSNSSVPWTVEPCIDYSLGSGTEYPVVWCEHDEGDGDGYQSHRWPTFANEAVWSFFAGLPDTVEGTNEPLGGGNAAVSGSYDTTISFTLSIPQGIGNITQGSVSAYSSGLIFPIRTAPIAFLNNSFALGAIGPGSVQSYTIPVKYQAFGGKFKFPGTYSLLISVYVDDGGYPIPATGKDHVVIIPITLTTKNTPIVIPGVLNVIPVQSF